MILLYPNYAKKSRQQSRILPQAQHKHRHIIPDPAPTAAYGIRKYLLCDLLRILFFQCLYHIPHPLFTFILQCIQHTVRHHDEQVTRCQLPHPDFRLRFLENPQWQTFSSDTLCSAAFFQKSGRTSDFADLALSALQIQAADIHRRMIFLLILRIQCGVQHIYGFFGVKSRLQHFFHEIQYSAAAPAGIFSRTGSVG